MAVPSTFETGWDAKDWNNTTDIDPTTANLQCGTWTTAPGSQENLPINCLNWYEAYAFCIWDGGFLPSEAEWEYAAAGGSEQREYPWGATDPGTTNQYAIYNGYYTASVTLTAPVGSTTLGVGLWGQLDLAGDVEEWTLDWFANNYANPCADCADLATASSRAVRGGNYNYPSSYLQPPSRGVFMPSVRNSYIGFRCARAP